MPLLTVKDLVAGYQPDLPILNDISLNVQHKELITIIGPNGAGKSTLIKAIAGLLKTSGGSIVYEDRDITHRPTHELINIGIAYVPQTANIFTSLSVYHNLRLAGHSLNNKHDRQSGIEKAYQLFPILAEKRQAKGHVLSGGQRQMLALAMALMCNPGLVMLDEPSAGLAPQVVTEVFQRIRDLVDNGIAVLMVEQNAKAALAISDRGYVLAEGRNQLTGNAQSLLNDPMVAEVYLGTRRQAL